MELKITTKDHKIYTVTEEALRDAEWADVSQHPGWHVEEDEFDRDRLKVEQNETSDGVYRGIEAEVQTTDGETITLSATIDTFDEDEWCVDWKEVKVVSIEGDGYENEDYCVSDLWEVANMEPKEFEPDFEELAEEWLDENAPNGRFWFDTARGFANEWTILIDQKGEIPEDDRRLEDYEEIDRDEAIERLSRAIMDKETYKQTTGAEKCCGAEIITPRVQEESADLDDEVLDEQTEGCEAKPQGKAAEAEPAQTQAQGQGWSR